MDAPFRELGREKEEREGMHRFAKRERERRSCKLEKGIIIFLTIKNGYYTNVGVLKTGMV